MGRHSNRVRNKDPRGYQDVGEPVCGEAARERAALKEATERWHEMMKAAGYKPRIGKLAERDGGLPKKIAPAHVPMGGSSLGDL